MAQISHQGAVRELLSVQRGPLSARCRSALVGGRGLARNDLPLCRFAIRTVSWQISMPRAGSRSRTFRNERGNRTYVITTSRTTSADALKRWSGLWGLLIVGSRLQFATGKAPAFCFSIQLLCRASAVRHDWPWRAASLLRINTRLLALDLTSRPADALDLRCARPSVRGGTVSAADDQSGWPARRGKLTE